jgi:hypothetical protein
MSLQDFIDNFEGGTRKNRFRIIGTIPPIDTATTDIEALNFDDYHVEATSFPASILTENPIDYLGRKIYYPGDRIYGENGFNLWTVSFLDDLDVSSQKFQTFWRCLHAWNNHLNNHILNVGDTSLDADLTVTQFNLNDTDEGLLKTAILKECWPQSVGKIDFQMQARDQYARFDVTFCFKYVEYTLTEPEDPAPG